MAPGGRPTPPGKARMVGSTARPYIDAMTALTRPAAALVAATVLGLFASTMAFTGEARADDSQVQTQASRVPPTVSIPIRTIDTPGRSGQSGIVEITVGRSAPMAVMLDTGSVGLRLWGGSPPGAQMSSDTITTSLDGISLPGAIGKASMALGGVTTTLKVPFQLINTDSSYIELWKRRGIVGILGIGVGTGALTNPLVAMPGSLGLRWSVHFARPADVGARHKGALVLGAQPPADSTMSFQLPYVGLNVNGARLWNDHEANGCWKFGQRPRQCVPTWFDSGFTVMRVKGARFSGVPQTATDLVRTGTAVSLSAGSSSFVGHRFRAGDTGSRNLVRVLPHGRSTINTGNSFYFDFTVTYDVVTGGLYLSDPTRKVT